MKHQWENHQNQRKFTIEKTTSRKTLKNWVRDTQCLRFGRFGEAPGRHWGVPGRHVGVSWALLGASWAPLWSHGCFGLDLGRVWEALGRFLGGLREHFGRILGRFWEDIFVSETPALPRQLAWRQQFSYLIQTIWNLQNPHIQADHRINDQTVTHCGVQCSIFPRINDDIKYLCVYQGNQVRMRSTWPGIAKSCRGGGTETRGDR